MKRFHSYGSVICRRKASFLLLRDDVGGSDNGGEPKRPFQQILHSIYGWAHLCIIKGTSYKVKNYRKTGMLPIPESLLLKKRTEMDDDSTKIHDNLVRHEKTYIQIPSHLRCFSLHEGILSFLILIVPPTLRPTWSRHKSACLAGFKAPTPMRSWQGNFENFLRRRGTLS